MGKSVLKEFASRKLSAIKRYAGYASVTAVIASFVLPGPHTVVMVGGLVAGVVIARATGKKNR